MSPPSLPSDAKDQVYVKLSILPLGTFHLLDEDVFQDSYDSGSKEGQRVPSLGFLIQHGEGKETRRVVWDLGLRKHGKGYPPAFTQEDVDSLQIECEKDVVDVLKEGGVELTDIDAIIFRYAHRSSLCRTSHSERIQFILLFSILEFIPHIYTHVSPFV
jgi:hypothetical protein